GEAASVDLVLVIDTSSSMSYDTAGDPTQPQPDNPADDPAFCNNPANATPCEPLTQVKESALAFIDTMFFPYDRVSIVAMTSQIPDGTRDHVTVLPLSSDYTAVANAINSLKVFQPPNCFTNPLAGFCLEYDSDGNPDTYEATGTFIRLDCPAYWNTGDPSSCPSSNIGGALWEAGTKFTEPGYRRDESLWVIVLLAGGPANATDPDPANGLPYGYCPVSTWNTQPWCRDTDIPTITRHYPAIPPNPTDPNFDADDFARWKADSLADPVDGNGITIFTIGLGEFVKNTAAGLPDSGERLLKYIAENAGDCPTCAPPKRANHGTYSYAPDPDGLQAIFLEIAKNIFTRIAQ
ncbi:MAG TPA: VWA domain-containing protein, partial [Anaerolineales bacterium]